MTRNYVGVDPSKDRLDIHIPQSGFARIANTKAELHGFLRRLGAQEFLVFDATSL